MYSMVEMHFYLDALNQLNVQNSQVEKTVMQMLAAQNSVVSMHKLFIWFCTS